MKLLLLIFLLPFTSTPIGYRQLTWSDFKGKPTNDHAASTCTGIVIEKDTAYAIFEPDRSWTRTSDGAILRHEQLHFIITEICACRISKYIKWKKKSGTKYKDIDLAFQLDHWDEMQQDYDRDTNHGQDTAAQKKWEQMIKL